MKRVFAFLLSAVMLFGTGVTASADADPDVPIKDEIVEDYQYTSEIRSSLSISSKTATCKSTVYGFSSKTTKVEITQTLYQKIGDYWYYVTSWNKTANTWYAIYTTTKSSLSSGTYRLKTEAKVYSGSAYETITVYSNTATC